MNIKNILQKNKETTAVFFLTFILFFIVQFSSGGLAGNDSHLYIKLADMVKSGGLIKEFPWLNATIMKDNFTGLHFLYYILLIPFTYFGSLIIGAKIASLFFLSLMMAVFYAVLKSLKLKYSFFWYLLLLSSSGYFIFRMNLARPLNFSVVIILAVFYALLKKNNLLLFATSFLFVWAHGSFPLSVFLTLVFIFVNYIQSKKIYYKLLLSSLGGIILATFVNPFFPKNVSYFSIYYLNSTPYSLTSGIAEWQPLGIDQLFFDAPVFLPLFLLTVVVYMLWLVLKLINNISFFEEKPDRKTALNFSLILSVIFLIGTFIQGRFIDYWTPFAVIFVALSFESLYSEFAKKGFFKKMTDKIKWPGFFSLEDIKLTGVILLLTGFGILILSKANFVLYMSGDGKLDKDIQQSSEWLIKNTPEKSIVFNVNWGNFSKLFLFNSHNYYIMGLDPKFMASPERYWLYSNIGNGMVCEKEKCLEQEDKRSIYDIIKKEFNADYVYIPKNYKDFDYTNLVTIMAYDSRFEKTHENESGQIWILK